MTTKYGPDMINQPPHYTSHPSGIECIQVTEHMNFNLGNAVKYIWRASEKGEHLEDLRKALWYLNREIKRVEGPAIKPLSMTRVEERIDALRGTATDDISWRYAPIVPSSITQDVAEQAGEPRTRAEERWDTLQGPSIVEQACGRKVDDPF